MKYNGLNEVEVKNLITGDIYREKYDKLILSPGARPIVPNIPGKENVNLFTIRNVVDIDKLNRFIKEIEGYYKDCNVVMNFYNERKPVYSGYSSGYSNSYYNNKNTQTRSVATPVTSAINKKETNNINWGVGDKVNHAVYGFGVVLQVKGQLIDIAFKDNKVGVKTMLANHASLSKE